MIREKMYEYTRPRRTGIQGSIQAGDSTRFEKAVEEKIKFEKFKIQFPNKSERINHIVNLVNQFLEAIEIDTYPNKEIIWENIAKDVLNDKKKTRGFYEEIKKKYHLNDERHIVWMKFTRSGCLGIVAAGADINFDTDNTSGRIIKHVEEQWDEELVLLFPLSKIGFGLRRDIECGIGNYLQDSGIPILDFYSHMY